MIESSQQPLGLPGGMKMPVELSKLSERPVPANVTDPESYRAARSFEAVFTRKLFKEMMGDASMIGGKGMGGEMFQEMYVDMIGDELAASGNLGIAEMIYRKVMEGKGLEPFKRLEAAEVSGAPIPEGPRAIEPVKPKVGDRIDWSTLDPSGPRFSRDVISFEDLARNAAERHDIEPELILAVMQQESRGDVRAQSHAGAKGLMQLIDSTAAAMGVEDSFDPHQNVDGGARYLRRMLDRFDGDMTKALAAYNAGPGAVSRYGGVPPYRETQNYVQKVSRNYDALMEARKAQPTSADRYAELDQAVGRRMDGEA